MECGLHIRPGLRRPANYRFQPQSGIRRDSPFLREFSLAKATALEWRDAESCPYTKVSCNCWLICRLEITTALYPLGLKGLWRRGSGLKPTVRLPVQRFSSSTILMPTDAVQ